MDQSKKTMRHFYCRDVLWETFEQMANDFDCSIDYLINEAMRFYARSKNYQAGAASSQSLPQQRSPRRPKEAGGSIPTARATARWPPPPPRACAQTPAPSLRLRAPHGFAGAPGASGAANTVDGRVDGRSGGQAEGRPRTNTIPAPSATPCAHHAGGALRRKLRPRSTNAARDVGRPG